MRGRQRKHKTLEDSVDERNRKLEDQLFSSCRDSRKKDYRLFIDKYKKGHYTKQQRTEQVANTPFQMYHLR